MSEGSEAIGGAGARLVLAVRKEPGAGEQRVAIVPDTIARLQQAGIDVVVESGAGGGAWLADESYVAAGAAVVPAKDVFAADIVVTVTALAEEDIATLRPGQVVVGMLQPLIVPEAARLYAERGVTAVSLDGLPRTLSRAQTMDALTSQANVAGYKAAVLAADTFGRFFPLMITAAGTAKPAEVLVLGAGVAGLAAMGTARRLGAVVTGYDVRPEARGEIESVGARFLHLESVGAASGEGGYARALTPEEQAAQQAELDGHIARYDVVITTAQVPGRRPPVLVTADAVGRMRAGSVVVDLAAGPRGGNVEGSEPERTVVTPNGVSVIGAGNLPSRLAGAASAAFSHNLAALVTHLVRDGRLHIDPADEITAGVVVTHDGQVIHPAVAKLLSPLST